MKACRILLLRQIDGISADTGCYATDMRHYERAIFSGQDITPGLKVLLKPRLARGPCIHPNAVPVMRGVSGPGVGCRARRRRTEGEGPEDADRRALRADCLRPAQTYPAAQERV